jgi:hypothetical protein
MTIRGRNIHVQIFAWYADGCRSTHLRGGRSGPAGYDQQVETDSVSRCRACGAPLEMVHGHGACLRSGCVLFGQVQEDCCTGAPERTDEAAVPDAQPPPAPIPWTERRDEDA